MSQLIAKCWADEGFKKKLLADPETTLRAEGIEWPAGRSIKVLADDDTVLHLVIPAKTAALSDEDLEKVAGGRMETHLRSGGVNPIATTRDKTLNS